MVILKKNQIGLSLIELMITISLLAILVVTGTAFTTLWSKQTQLDNAVMSFQSAIGLAKSTALRNEFAINSDLPSSRLCFDSSTAELTVRKASLNSPASCESTIVFSALLKNSIEIKSGSDTALFECFALNSYGQIIPEGSCKTDLSIIINNGTLNDNLIFN